MTQRVYQAWPMADVRYRRGIERQRRKPRHPGGVVFALRERSAA